MDDLMAFANDLRLKGFAESTVNAYVWKLGVLPFELPGDVRTARSYRASRQTKVKTATLIFEIRAMKAYSKWWADQCDADDPLAALTYPKQTQPLPGRIADDADITRVLAMLKHWRAARWNVRDYALVRTFEFTGMRRSEVARMKVADIQVDLNRIAVPVAKNGHGRYVPLAPPLAKALRNWMSYRERHGIENDELWVGDRGPLRADSLCQILERVSARAGVNPPLLPHQFRRRLAREWVRNGGTDDALMLVAGWKSPTMPARYRAEASAELAHEQYDRIFGDPNPPAPLKPERRSPKPKHDPSTPVRSLAPARTPAVEPTALEPAKRGGKKRARRSTERVNDIAPQPDERATTTRHVLVRTRNVALVRTRKEAS